MNRILTLGALPLVLAAAAACAPRATQAAGAADEPRLEGCSAFQTAEPGLSSQQYSQHFVTVRVDATGRVVPGSAEVLRARATVTNREQRARQLAESCTFEPAKRDGTPTDGRAQVRVYVPNEVE